MEAGPDGGPPDPHDDADFAFDQAAQQHPADGTLDLLAAFINEMEGLSCMTGPDISDIIDNLQILHLLQRESLRDIVSMIVNHAVQVWH